MSNSVNIRCVMAGDPRVGKTSVAHRFVTNEFDPCCRSTVGCMFKECDLEDDDCIIKLSICDTAGQEQYRSIVPMYFRGADFVLCVFDLTDHNSFENIDEWIRLVHEYEPGAIVILVGNKNDLEDQTVSIEEAADFAIERNYEIMYTSARTGSGVEDVFNRGIDLVLEKAKKQENGVIASPVPHPVPNPVPISNQSSEKSSCC